jgi:hypothetical protein
MAGQCHSHGQAPGLNDPIHCRLGDVFSATTHSSSGRRAQRLLVNGDQKAKRRNSARGDADVDSRDFPVCRLNHLRPQFFTKCSFGESECSTYNGQRGVYLAPDKITSSLGWAAKEVRTLVEASLIC